MSDHGDEPDDGAERLDEPATIVICLDVQPNGAGFDSRLLRRLPRRDGLLGRLPIHDVDPKLAVLPIDRVRTVPFLEGPMRPPDLIGHNRSRPRDAKRHAIIHPLLDGCHLHPIPHDGETECASRPHVAVPGTILIRIHIDLLAVLRWSIPCWASLFNHIYLFLSIVLQ